MASLLSASIVALALLGGAKVTEPANSSELAKTFVFHMDADPGRYTDKEFDENVILYVLNGTNQNLINPKFEADYTTPGGKLKGVQASIKMSSTLSGAYYGVLLSG